MIAENILGAIGKTPLVRLNRLPQENGVSARVYAKCEFLNPGGSVKDRAAFNMIREAERAGRIRPGDTLIEPTSGNTGIGIAMAAAVLGYKAVIVMPDKMSREKELVLQALGAEIIRTPAEVSFDSPESHISAAARLQKERPRAHILDQYANPDNYKAHYKQTAEEILGDLNNQIDMLAAGAGTGGSLTGLALRIKEVCPDCEIIGADPEGSILAGEGPIRPYEVEGIGYDFIPENLNRSLVGKWVKTRDKESFETALLAIRKEGLLCGGSGGAALYAAFQEARRLKPSQNCVVIIPDGVRNYMSKFLDPLWRKRKGL